MFFFFFFFFFFFLGNGAQVAYNDKRTSDNAFDTSSPTAKALKKRALDLMGMGPYDEKLTDGLQVLRYNLTTAYNSHMDYLDDNGGGHDYDSANQVRTGVCGWIFCLFTPTYSGRCVFVLLFLNLYFFLF